MDDLDDLELDLSTEWDHATKRGKHPQAVAYLRARRGVARAKGKLRGGAAVSERARLDKVPITLPSLSIQRKP